ncbi:MAG TPA: hypothetical protein VMV08_07140 [Gaiellaceae bacterium]|nr:hypothetical protein [Gaiellaceae bacterium]
MHGVECSELWCFGLRGELADGVVKRDEPETVEDCRNLRGLDARTATSAPEFDLTDDARDALRPPFELSQQRCALSFDLHELNQCGAVDVEESVRVGSYSRSSRS